MEAEESGVAEESVEAEARRGVSRYRVSFRGVSGDSCPKDGVRRGISLKRLFSGGRGPSRYGGRGHTER